MRVAKRRFCQSAPELPHTYGFGEEGEFAPINNNESPKKGRKEGENAAENAKAFERRCRPPITENRRRQLAEVFVSRNNHSRKQNRAFSGYARGWFLTIPCRALLASASAPPPYSRKSRFAAIFRELFGYIL